jgi:hypothetical protein
VGKSSVGYAIFQQVYRSGSKVAYVDLDQVGLCYPSPADDPHNHRVKAQNLGVVWPGPGNSGASGIKVQATARRDSSGSRPRSP